MKYLKFVTLTSVAFLLLATSCREEAKDPPASFDPPVIAITNETPMVVNLYNPNDRPYIQGTVTTQGSLTNVTISVLAGGGTAVLQTVTDFGDNPQQFEINIRPNYAMGMTGIRVSATDAQSQTTTLDFPFQVVSQEPPRTEIIFTTAPGLIVDFNTVDFENMPRIQGRVVSQNALTRVRIFRMIGTAQQEIEDITTFSNPLEFPFDVQLDFRPNMTGLRVIATDEYGQTTIETFNFQVTDFTMPTELTPATGNRLAFPTAEGAGRYTWGGRGGQVLVVTNRNNAGHGSFRWAIEHPGARTIVFDVYGEITLTGRLNINNDSVTIAGQSAPGDGVTIRGERFVLNNANQVIVRYLRIRSGIANGGDAFEGNSQSNIILDHLSMSWADDEVASFYNNRYFTMQWSIISEPFGARNNAGNAPGTRGMGGLMGGHTATFANNLFAHTRSRNPRFNGARLSGRNPALEMADFVNNVMFNFGTSPNGGELGRYNFQNNFFRPGPATPTGTVQNRFLNLYARDESASVPEFRDLGWFFMTGNVMEGNTALTNNNWNNVALQSDPRSRGANVNNVRVNEPFMPEFAINMRTAQEALEVVTERAGASLRRDAIDTRIVGEVRAGNATFPNGHLAGNTIPGGWHVHQGEPVAPRFLRNTANDDGIPDWFKIQHRLPLGQNMANRHSICPVFTNLEVYLNSIVEHIHQ